MARADAVRRIRREPGEALELVIPQRGLEIKYGAWGLGLLSGFRV